jgi:ribokinase
MAEFTLLNNPAKALRFAAAASAIQVTRAGAAPAIPLRDEVLNFLKENP